MDRWGNLNMKQKAQLLGIYASKGYTDLASIINHYNTFQAGGTVSTPNFVQRYSEGQRRGIKLPNGEVATHKLSYAEQDGKYIVYPNVQPMDYSDPNSPLYDYEDDNWTAFDRALKNNDTLQFNTAKEAEEYTKHYKDFGREGYLLNIPSKINLSEPKVKLQQGGHLYQNGGPFKIGYAAPPISSELEGAPITSPTFSTKKLAYGSNEATRVRVREKYPVINQVVDSVAKAYGLNPSVLNNRVDSEGLIDRIAQLNDEAVEGARDFRHNWQTNNPRGYDFPTNGFHWYGLDDVATLIAQGKVQPINEVWEDEWNENEKGRMVHSASGKTWVDNIGLMGATLKYFRSLVEKDFPGKDDKFYDEGALAYWNRGHTGGKKYMQGPRTDSRYKTFSTGGSLGHITPYGQWQYPHQITTIPSNNVTMKGVDYPVLGISDTGDTKYMLPNMDYLFDGNYVTEYPLHKFQKGGNTDGISSGRWVQVDNETVTPEYSLPPVTIEAEHPLWSLPWYKDKKNNPNINRHKDQLYNNWRRHNETGKEYLKRVAGGLSVMALPIGGAAGFILGVPDLATDFAEMTDKPSVSNATELTLDAPTRYGTELDNALISVLKSNRYTKPLAKILEYNDILQYIGAANDASTAITGKSIIEHVQR